MPDLETPGEALAPPNPDKPEKLGKPPFFFEKRFAPVYKIVLSDKSTLLIPQDALSNTAANQILVGKLRALFNAQLKLIEDGNSRLDPVALKDLTVAHKNLVELTNAVYELREPASPEGRPSSELGRLAAAMVKGAAEGLAKGAGDSLDERMKRIEALGRKTKRVVEATVVDVKPA